MPDFRTRTPGPISVTLELGTGDVRIAASDRTDTVVEAGSEHRPRARPQLLENATRPEEAHETVEVRGHTSYGDITIRRSRLASGTGEEGQP